MTFPAPVPGLVICYSYLWRDEYLRGREEGTKDRPCAVLLTVAQEDGKNIVVVLPVTHVPPTDASQGAEIPAATKQRLGLDNERSWIILSESNRFVWPGPDLRPAKPGDAASVVYGTLPSKFFEEVRRKWLALVESRQSRGVARTE